jgi:hypothetical protein
MKEYLLNCSYLADSESLHGTLLAPHCSLIYFFLNLDQECSFKEYVLDYSLLPSSSL